VVEHTTGRLYGLHDLTVFAIFFIDTESKPGPPPAVNEITQPMKRIKLLLVEDNRLLREGISSLMKDHDDIRVVAAFGANENILGKIGLFKPHVMLLDLGLRSQNSLQLVRTAKINSPATKVIVMDLIPTQEDVLEFVRAGVSGFILKDATIDDFLHTIRSVAEGAKVLPSVLTGSLFSQIITQAINGIKGPSSKLMESVRMTKRERQVIELIADGMTNKEIAQRLHLSTFTIKSHVHNILEKLTLHTRVQIARYAHTSERYQEIESSVSLLHE
jgi:two-component system response regulator DegU